MIFYAVNLGVVIAVIVALARHENSMPSFTKVGLMCCALAAYTLVIVRIINGESGA